MAWQETTCWNRKRERGWLCWSLCGEPGSDPVEWPFTSRPMGLAWMSFWILLTGPLGPRRKAVPVSKRAWQPRLQATTVPLMEMLRGNGIKQAPTSLWNLPHDCPLNMTAWLSPEQPFNPCPDSVFLCYGHFILFDFPSVIECTSSFISEGLGMCWSPS